MNFQTRTVDTNAASAPSAAGNGATAVKQPERLHADHLSLKRLGNWTTADRFEVRARRGAVVVDLRSPHIPAGDIIIDLDIDRGMVKLLVAEDAVVEHWDVAWIGRGKVKDSARPQTTDSDGAAAPRRIVLMGRIQDGEIRVARGGVAMLAAMFSREYADDLRRSHREGTTPTVDDPARAIAAK